MDRLANTVRPYAWGSRTAIPDLLGTTPTGEPQAELWMGAHPGAPSLIDRGAGATSLLDVISADPEAELGPDVTRRFGPRLPFLVKLLAADAPLSLQVHPDAARAAAGYADEERRGVPLDAPHRNYQDAAHKPELICALTPFEGLCGFRAPAETANLLAALDVGSLLPYVDILRAHPEGDALREVLTAVLTAEPDAMARTATEAATAAARLADRTTGAESAGYAGYAALARHYPGDPGVIAAMLLNHVTLAPGEALYLGAGVPHAYLAGLGVEIMASSDNVLRCGLTPKHVDVPELLRVVRFTGAPPRVLRPEADAAGEEVYATPASEFRLSRHVLTDGGGARPLTTDAPQVLLCVAGTALLRSTDPAGGDTAHPPMSLTAGQSAYLPAGEAAWVSGAGTLFRATVGAG